VEQLKAKYGSMVETPLSPDLDFTTGLPPRFTRWRMKDFSPSLIDAARPFFQAVGCWSLYLWGETGTRKTSFAIASLIHMREHTRTLTGLFLPAYECVRQLRNIHDPMNDAVLARWRKAMWLVFDDLGKHRDTPHIVEQLLFLLHYRYDWHEPGYKTIITANMSLDQLAKTIDPATARRLEEGKVLKLELPQENTDGH